MPEAVCRLSKSCAKRALKNSEKGDLESIHSTRKEIKKLRALLRLVRHEIGKKAFEQVLDGLREAADRLAPARDAQVKAKTLEDLTHERRNRIIPGSFGRFRSELNQESQEEAVRFRENKCAREVRRILRKQPKLFGRLYFENAGWAAICPGIKKSYSAAREARDLARSDGSVENFHEWRKRVKDLWYYVQLLEPVWPEQMCAVADELEKLGELLGNDHDLYLLRQTAIKKSVNVDLEPEAHALLKVIEMRRTELRSEALKLGNRFFEERPAEFCERIHRYWKLWKWKKSDRKTASKDQFASLRGTAGSEKIPSGCSVKARWGAI